MHALVTLTVDQTTIILQVVDKVALNCFSYSVYRNEKAHNFEIHFRKAN